MNKNINVTFETINDFAQYIKEHILDYLPDEYEESKVEINDTVKVNDNVLTGLTIKLIDKSICPNIYLNGYYARYLKGENIRKLCSEIAGVRLKSEYEDAPITLLSSFINAQDKIRLKLINREENIMYLQDKPFMTFLDLAIIYYIDLGKANNGTMSCPITKSLMRTWGVNIEDIDDAARYNLECEKVNFRTMFSVLKELSGIDLPFEENTQPMLYVLTNEEKCYGARMMLSKSAKDLITTTLNQDAIIIPSSIHEVLVMPYDREQDIDRLEDMIKEVNETQVPPEDRLSAHVYYLDPVTKTIHVF